MKYKLTTKDWITNKLLKFRFWFYKNFWNKKLKNDFSLQRKNWQLTFEDEFNHATWGYSDNYEKWYVGQGWDPYVPPQLSWPGPPEHIKDTSFARFTVKYNPKMVADPSGNEFSVPYQGSEISSGPTFKQQYGRFECRMTIPHERGVHGAFWMWGSTWPPEIDIYEFWGRTNGKDARNQVPNLHWGVYKTPSKGALYRWPIKLKNDYVYQFHHFAVEWYPDKIEFFTDGVKVYKFTDKKFLTWFNVETAKMWIVLSHGVDPFGDYVQPNELDYYSEFLVDYVRAYKKI